MQLRSSTLLRQSSRHVDSKACCRAKILCPTGRGRTVNCSASLSNSDPKAVTAAPRPPCPSVDAADAAAAAAVVVDGDDERRLHHHQQQQQQPQQQHLDAAANNNPNVSSDDAAVAAMRRHHRRCYPLAAVVGQEHIKAALLLAAVDPLLGGVGIAGGRGTAKSVLARGAAALLPPIEVVEGSHCNADPADPSSWEDGLLERLQAAAAAAAHAGGSGSSSSGGGIGDETTTAAALASVPTRLRPAPFVTVPLGVTEDRLAGTVDVDASVREGRAVLQPGLLAGAHRGAVYVDELNLLDEGAANLLLTALADGRVAVEREGLSASHPCRALLVATWNPDEGALREHLLDRLALVLGAEAPPTPEARLEAVDAALRWQDDRTGMLADTEDATAELAARVARARELLPRVAITRDQVRALVEAALRARLQGHRGELFAARVARAAAALGGRTSVAAGDLRLAADLVIAPRAAMQGAPPEDEDDDRLQPPPPPPPPPPPDRHQDNEEEEQQQDDEQQEQEQQQEPQLPEEQPLPEQFFFAPDEAAAIAPSLLALAAAQRRGKGRGGRAKAAVIYSDERGRYVKPSIPKAANRIKRLAVDATLRAAAPHQRWRRARIEAAAAAAEAEAEAEAEAVATDSTQQQQQQQQQHTAAAAAAATSAADPELSAQLRKLKERHAQAAARAAASGRRVLIDRDDLRAKRLARKAGGLVVFVVDASGSMALNRMAAAKGAILRLLADSYRSRDRIALVAFCGLRADVLLPPSRSTTLARRRLEALPCGGGSPLAHALSVALRTALNAKQMGDVSRVTVVLVTDGRANVSLAQSANEPGAVRPPQAEVHDEAVAIARKLGAADAALLVVDTEAAFMGSTLARRLAEAAGGRYWRLPSASDGVLAAAAAAFASSSSSRS